MKAGIIAAAALTLFLAERLITPKKELGFKHDLVNVCTGILNYLVIGLTGIWLTSAVATFAHDNHIGLFRLLSIPDPAVLFLSLVFLDLYLYLWHRLAHRSNLLFRLHSVHHNDPRMNVSTAFRFNFGELALSFLARSAYLMLLGLPFSAIVIFEITSNCFIYFHHSSIKVALSFDRPFSLIFISPFAHRHHHSPRKKPGNSNFGVIFSFWDRIFGTWYYDRRDNEHFGLVGLKNETSLKNNFFLPFYNRTK